MIKAAMRSFSMFAFFFITTYTSYIYGYFILEHLFDNIFFFDNKYIEVLESIFVI